MLDAEGAAQPGDVALVGDEREIEAALRRLAAAGVTDLNAAPFAHGPDAKASLERTLACLGGLARS
jgi:hypothetical protein